MSHCRFLLILGFSLFIAACNGDTNARQSQSGKSSEDVKKETSEAYDALKAYSTKKKLEFEQQARATLESLDKQIEELKMKTEKASSEARKKYDAAVEEWNNKKAALAIQLEDLKTASADSWEEIEKRIENDMEELKKLYEDARSALS